MTISLVNASSSNAKPLTEKDRLKLAEVARTHYDMIMMEGASIIKFKGRDILLVIVDVKKTPNSQRVAQVKASRMAGEFLKEATNKSVTVYSLLDDNSYSLKDKSEELGSTSGSIIDDNISQTTKDMTTTSTEEYFSDKIIQSSNSRVKHIEPLCRISDNASNITFAYFLVIEK